MGNLMRSFWKEEDALGTVEMVLLLAALVAIALLFTSTVKPWVQKNWKRLLTFKRKNYQLLQGHWPCGT